MRNQKTFSLTLIAIGAAIIAVLSPFTIPIGIVPITLQTLAVALIATVLDPKETFFSILLYLILGSIGLPVFAGGSSGISAIFGPTGGFLVAFPFVGMLISYLLKKIQYQPLAAGLINILGQVLILIVGTVWLKFFTGADWAAALNMGFTPFLLVGTIKAIIATAFGMAILRALAHTNKYFTK